MWYSLRELTSKMQKLPITSQDRVKSPLHGWLYEVSIDCSAT